MDNLIPVLILSSVIMVLGIICIVISFFAEDPN